jgi:hypothetical protein
MPTFDSTIQQAVVNFSASGDNTIVAAVAKQTIQMVGILLVVSGNTSLTFKSGTGGTALSGAMAMLANGSLILDPSQNNLWYQTLSPANNLVLNSSSAVQVSGTVYYKQA